MQTGFRLFLFFILLFKLSAEDTLFTQEEKSWIQEHKEIKVGVETDWEPFDYVDEKGKHQGISQDYLDKISKRSGLEFRLYPDTWTELLQKIKAKKIDLLPALYYSQERSEYLEFTNKYLNLAEYLFTLTDTPKVESPSEAHGKEIAVVKGYEVAQWLKKRHPRVKVVLKDSLYDCVRAVSTGEVFGMIGDLPSTQFILQKYFINNLKVNILINDRDPIGLHMAARKDYKILASVISKSLDNITREEKTKIFSKYAKKQRKEGLRGAFGFGRPPFMYGKNSGKGIEETLVRQALVKRGFRLLEMRQMPIQRGQTILLTTPEVDFSVGVLEDKQDGLYYSDNFIQFENVAITRLSDKITITTINDLKNKKVVAWNKAYTMLGSEFKTFFNPLNRPDNYKEVFDQKLQHKSFFDKEADVILVDKNIFKWYVHKNRGSEADTEYEIHHVFSKPTWIKVSFRDKKLRDEFNLGLKAIRENGKYAEIVSDFTKIDLQKQLDLVQLISSLSAEYIFENKTAYLKILLSKFEHIKIIKGIEFISRNRQEDILKLEKIEGQYKEVEVFSWGNSQTGMILKPSYLHEGGNTIDVGAVKVYYRVHNFKDVDISYIPPVENFQDLPEEEYAYIASIYKRLNLNSELTKLSVTEQKWIQDHPLIRFVGDPNWLPFEAFNKEGQYIGIVSEYLKEIENVTGLKFQKIQTTSWEESVALIHDKKADIISETTDSQMRKHLSFTKAYLENHIVIVMDSEEKYVDSLAQIQDKKIVVIKNYGYVAKIKEAYPTVSFIEAEDVSQALKIVSLGRADALLCTMALGSHYIAKDGFVNLRIVGKTEFSTSIGYGVQPELEPLVGIINKAMLTLAEGKKQEILKKWTVQKYIEKVDYTLVWQVLGAAFVLLSLFLYWNRQMQKEIGLRRKAEEELQEVNDQVHKSIEFSSMIQRALIPDKNTFKAFFSSYFTLWRPRDIVGGDIYFFETLRHKDEAILMVVDCTGHGVPGAFVTMLVKAIERNVTGFIKKSDEDVSPAKLLGILNRSMKHLLKQNDKTAESNAGFDAGILYINKKEKIARYAGAEIALYYQDNKKLTFLKGDRHSIGYRTSKEDYIFTDYQFSLSEKMRFFITTDGYLDQNGGPKGFPFGKKKFKKILEENCDTDMTTIEEVLMKNLENYQADYEANDDVTIVGVQL